MEMEVVKHEFGWFKASTLVMGYSTEDVEKYMTEMIDWYVGEDTKVHKTKKGVWTMIYEWKSTKVENMHFGWDVNKSKMHLACPTSMAKVLEASFD